MALATLALCLVACALRFLDLAVGGEKVGARFDDKAKAAVISGIADMLSPMMTELYAASCVTETGGGAGGPLDLAMDSCVDWAFQAFFVNSAATRLAGEGGGLRQHTMRHWDPKVYTERAQIREGARDPSGSSKARTREDCDPGWKRDGQHTQEGS